MKSLNKIAVVNSHPTQYFGPLYRYLNNDDSIELTALYCCDVNIRESFDEQFQESLRYDNDILSGYRSIFLGKRSSKREVKGFWSLIVPEIWTEIRTGGYDVVWIHGYSFFAFILALMAAKSKNIKVYFRGETHLHLKRTKFKQLLHELLIKNLFKLYDGFLAIGTQNKRYYLAMGVKEDKIFDVPYTIDNNFFSNSSSQSYALNTQKYFKDRPSILFASKFMPRKHPMDLLHASLKLHEKGIKHNLIFVGSGEMQDKMNYFIDQNSMNHVSMLGFVNQSELPHIYQNTDIFVLPSSNEPWGLIVNEVMASGMPVVVASEVGCALDLVKHGLNGFQFKVNNIDDLTNCLAKIINDIELMESMGKESKKIISEWSFEQCRIGINRALQIIK